MVIGYNSRIFTSELIKVMWYLKYWFSLRERIKTNYETQCTYT